MKHVTDNDLALYAAGDLSLWRRTSTRLHVWRCEECRERVEAYRSDRKSWRGSVDELPEGVDWDRLSAEMSANIRVGLAAGECVAPRDRRPTGLGWFMGSWRPAAITAGVVALLACAWWLNMPKADTEALARVASIVVHGGRSSALPDEQKRPMVQATADGVELRENGGSMGMAQSGSRLMTVSVSMQGSASTRYIDPDTEQVTITSVYVQ